jgi:hypothetical protein
VKLLALDHRFAVALHSPGGVVETGLFAIALEKMSCTGRQQQFSKTFSPGRFEGIIDEIAPIFRISSAIQADFLGTTLTGREHPRSVPSCRRVHDPEVLKL